MKGKVVSQKYPVGLYHVQVVDVVAGIDSKGHDLILVHYENMRDSPRPGDRWKERLKSPSPQFLKGLGLPHDYGENWDTNDWRGRTMWVNVKYTLDEAAWPRYEHSQIGPKELEPGPPTEIVSAAPDDSWVPF